MQRTKMQRTEDMAFEPKVPDILVKFSKPLHIVQRQAIEVYTIEFEITDDILKLLENPLQPFLEVVKRKFPGIEFSQVKFNPLFNSTEIQLAHEQFRVPMQDLLESMQKYGFAGGENGTHIKRVDDNLWVSFAHPQELMLFLDDHFDRNYPNLPLKFIGNSKILINCSGDSDFKVLIGNLQEHKITYHHNAAFFTYLALDNSGNLIADEDLLHLAKKEADNYNTYGFADKRSFFKYAPMTKIDATRFSGPEVTRFAGSDVGYSWKNDDIDNIRLLEKFFENHVANFKYTPFFFEPCFKYAKSFDAKNLPDTEIELTLIEFDLDDKVLSLQANEQLVNMTYQKKLDSIVRKFAQIAEAELTNCKIDSIGSMAYEIDQKSSHNLSPLFKRISNFGLNGGNNTDAKRCDEGVTSWSIQQILAAAAMMAFEDLQYRICPMSKKMIILEDSGKLFEQCIDKLTQCQIIYKPVTFKIDLRLPKGEFQKQLSQFKSMGVGYSKSFEKKASENPEELQQNKEGLKAFFGTSFFHPDPMCKFVEDFGEKSYICVPIKNFSIDSRVLALADGKDMQEKCKKAIVKLLEYMDVGISEENLRQGDLEIAKLGKGFNTIFCPIENAKAKEVKKALSELGLHVSVLEAKAPLKECGLLFNMQSQFMAIFENVVQAAVQAEPQGQGLPLQPITHRFIGDVIQFFDPYKPNEMRGERALDKFFSYLKAKELAEKNCTMHFDCKQDPSAFEFQLYLHQVASNLFSDVFLESRHTLGYQNSLELRRFEEERPYDEDMLQDYEFMG